MNRTIYYSDVIITNNGSPINNGFIVVENSKIVLIGKESDLGSGFENFKKIKYKNSIICPGFINLHSHLAYSKINLVTSNDLFLWIEKLIDVTSSWSKQDYINSIQYGINECILNGTTFIVENTPLDITINEVSITPLKALIGIEVFGSEEDDAEAIFKNINLEKYFLNPNIEITLSPHAPYDVSKPLWEHIVNWSIKNKKKILTHLEESPEEKKWWQEKLGSGVSFWEKINKLNPKLKYWKKYNSGIDFLNKNNLLSENIIATHLCQASEEDLKILKDKNINLVHCPRSNFYLNSGTANLKLWNDLGILWGVGTDSMASNKDLDLLNEIRFMIKNQNEIYNYKINAEDAFKSITSQSAKILGKENLIGKLKNGYSADFLVYELDESDCTYRNPYETIVYEVENKNNLKEVWINGEKAFIQKGISNKI